MQQLRGVLGGGFLAVVAGALAIVLHAAGGGPVRSPQAPPPQTQPQPVQVTSRMLRVTAERTAIVHGQAATVSFTGLSAVGSRDAWVAGTRCGSPCTGFLALTRDGGATWSEVELGAVRPDELTFVDAQHGWIAATAPAGCFRLTGCAAVLLGTDDGAETWHELHREADENLIDLHFVSDEVGFGLQVPTADCRQPAGCAQLVTTPDGGRTWQPLTSPNDPAPKSVRFLDARRGWLVGSRCGKGTACTVSVFATVDGGRTWTRRLSTDIPADQGGGAVDFADAQHGWALFSDTRECSMGGCWGPLYRTVDGGLTWEVLP